MQRDAVLFDLSEFFAAPLRTGIQRVTFEILRNWNGPSLLPFVVRPSGKCRLLPADTLSTLEEFFGTRPGDPNAARRRLLRLGAHNGGRLCDTDFTQARAVINAELFFSGCRIAFYERLLQRGMARRLFFLVYDMLPWLHPGWFSSEALPGTLGYLRLLLRLENLAFISPQSQAEFSFRVKRSDRLVGRVLSLGSEGLGVATPAFDPLNRRFAVVGTLEPRKNIDNILDAFESLWDGGTHAELVLAGRMLSLSPATQQRIARFQKERPLFRWENDLDDHGIRRLIRGCRATIFASLGEGFGLPPLESLSLGVPVIATAGVPSLGLIEPHGQIRMHRADADEIRSAVITFLDDRQAEQKYREIPLLELPRWADLGRGCSRWLEVAD